MKNYTYSYPATDSDLTPCCYISEAAWTWLAVTLLSVTLLLLATLKYYKKVLDTEEGNVRKKEKVLKQYGLARQRGAKSIKLPDRPVNLENFKQGIQNRKLKPAILRIEFSSAAKKLEPLTKTCGQVRVNRNKNRDLEIIPYDYNRVVLQNRVVRDNYINASYVDDLVGGPGYIVTQGPLKNTVSDFWALVWQENVEVIVMLTRTFDFIKVECVQYWPAEFRLPEIHDRIAITIIKEIKFANYVQRILTVADHQTQMFRTVTQFHYTEWPAYARPRIGNLLEFRKKVALLYDKCSLCGPCLVHCNTGAGRSGVYIQVDANIRFVQKTKTLNIFGYLKILMEQRVSLVETEEHYRLVYNILEEYVVLGDTSLVVDSFMLKIHQLRNNDDQAHHEERKIRDDRLDYKKEMKLLRKLVPPLTMGQCAGGHMVGNRHKNRHALLVPPDSHRPYITSFQGNECTDYINAVFINGFKRSKEFIVTEWPTGETLADFWSLVYDHNVKTVVVLDNPSPSNKFPAIWPNPGCDQKYGSIFLVETVESDTSDTDWIVWRINLSKDELAPHRVNTVCETQGKKMSSVANTLVYLKDPIKSCFVYQMAAWPGGRKVPSDLQSLIRLVRQARAVEQGRAVGKADTPTVLVSRDGCNRVGLFCSAAYIKDKLERDAEVDVMMTVRNVRANRPQLVGSIEEYKFCYEVAEQLIINNRTKV